MVSIQEPVMMARVRYIFSKHEVIYLNEQKKLSKENNKNINVVDYKWTQMHKSNETRNVYFCTSTY